MRESVLEQCAMVKIQNIISVGELKILQKFGPYTR